MPKKRTRTKKLVDDEFVPFPTFSRPTKQECYNAVEALQRIHGIVSHTAQRSVLDSLCRTILSQNTTDKTSIRAFTSLKQAFPTWESVLKAKMTNVADAIRVGGLADIKATRIQTILKTLKSERPTNKLSLEYVRKMSDLEVKEHLSRFNGVGPKTVSCVLMFCLGRHDFPVDTHVWRTCKQLGWVPKIATRESTYIHMNACVPNEAKFQLHVLLVKHGKLISKAAKKFKGPLRCISGKKSNEGHTMDLLSTHFAKELKTEHHHLVSPKFLKLKNEIKDPSSTEASNRVESRFVKGTTSTHDRKKIKLEKHVMIKQELQSAKRREVKTELPKNRRLPVRRSMRIPSMDASSHEVHNKNW